MPMEFVGDRVADGGDFVYSPVEDKATPDKMIYDKNAHKHKMKEKLKVIDYKEICRKMLVEEIFGLLETGEISKSESSQIWKCGMDRLVETGEISEEEADRYTERLNEMYLEKFREIEEEEIVHPTLYGGITPYVCGGETSVEAAEMKHL